MAVLANPSVALRIYIYVLTRGILKELKVMDQLAREASMYFDHFVEAFATFEGRSVARLFAFPYLSVDQKGNRRVFFNLRIPRNIFRSIWIVTNPMAVNPVAIIPLR
jgi:hypothetical protein